MRIFSKQLVAYTSVLTFGAFSLFAAGTHAQNRAAAQNRFWSEMETVLSMTPAQKSQAQMAFDQARQEAQPVRKELRETTQALKTAVQSNNTGEIQKLSAREGHEIGKLVAIRSSAAAKVYQSLTPDQQTKAEALHRMMRRGFRHEIDGAPSPSGS